MKHAQNAIFTASSVHCLSPTWLRLLDLWNHECTEYHQHEHDEGQLAGPPVPSSPASATPPPPSPSPALLSRTPISPDEHARIIVAHHAARATELERHALNIEEGMRIYALKCELCASEIRANKLERESRQGPPLALPAPSLEDPVEGLGRNARRHAVAQAARKDRQKGCVNVRRANARNRLLHDLSQEFPRNMLGPTDLAWEADNGEHRAGPALELGPIPTFHAMAHNHSGQLVATHSVGYKRVEMSEDEDNSPPNLEPAAPPARLSPVVISDDEDEVVAAAACEVATSCIILGAEDEEPTNSAVVYAVSGLSHSFHNRAGVLDALMQNPAAKAFPALEAEVTEQGAMRRGT
ncbi:hypothetical protein FB451DRAFT_1483996 [Mycena latifolia]|nr:hypothetical protein FB451DRAFT_1483996 [Mycena latifolia]